MHVETTKNRITLVRWIQLTFQIMLDTTLSKQSGFPLIELVAMIILINIAGAVTSPARMDRHKSNLALG